MVILLPVIKILHNDLVILKTCDGQCARNFKSEILQKHLYEPQSKKLCLQDKGHPSLLFHLGMEVTSDGNSNKALKEQTNTAAIRILECVKDLCWKNR